MLFLFILGPNIYFNLTCKHFKLCRTLVPVLFTLLICFHSPDKYLGYRNPVVYYTPVPWLLNLCHFSDTLCEIVFVYSRNQLLSDSSLVIFCEISSLTSSSTASELLRSIKVTNANAMCPSLKDLGGDFNVPSQLSVNQRFSVPFFLNKRKKKSLSCSNHFSHHLCVVFG